MTVNCGFCYSIAAFSQLQQNKTTGMRLGRIMLMRLSVNCRIHHCWMILLSRVVGGNTVITCHEAQRDWLQQLHLMNNHWHVHHYANEAARVV